MKPQKTELATGKMMTAEECRRFANRCFEWAGQARHAEVRSVYFEMADLWTREAEQVAANEANDVTPARATHVRPLPSDPV